VLQPTTNRAPCGRTHRLFFVEDLAAQRATSWTDRPQVSMLALNRLDRRDLISNRCSPILGDPRALD
jgi:hypothetical protein